MDPWQRIKSFQIPQFIKLQDEKYFPSDQSDDSLALHSVRYINHDVLYMVLIYQGVIGTLKLDYEKKQLYINLVEKFSCCFRPIFKFNENDKLHGISISDSQQFMTVNFTNKVNNAGYC